MTRRTVSKILEDIEEENLVLLPSHSDNSEFPLNFRYLRSSSKNQEYISIQSRASLAARHSQGQ